MTKKITQNALVAVSRRDAHYDVLRLFPSEQDPAKAVVFGEERLEDAPEEFQNGDGVVGLETMPEVMNVLENGLTFLLEATVEANDGLYPWLVAVNNDDGACAKAFMADSPEEAIEMARNDLIEEGLDAPEEDDKYFVFGTAGLTGGLRKCFGVATNDPEWFGNQPDPSGIEGLLAAIMGGHPANDDEPALSVHEG